MNDVDKLHSKKNPNAKNLAPFSQSIIFRGKLIKPLFYPQERGRKLCSSFSISTSNPTWIIKCISQRNPCSYLTVYMVFPFIQFSVDIRWMKTDDVVSTRVFVSIYFATVFLRFLSFLLRWILRNAFFLRHNLTFLQFDFFHVLFQIKLTQIILRLIFYSFESH